MQAGSTKNTKDSIGRRLGVKKFHAEEVYPNDIIIRQRGLKWHPGRNTYLGKDHTIHAKVEGVVKVELDPYRKKKLWRFNVEPKELPNRKRLPPPGYCYHPELFPERAMNNPEPTNLFTWKPKSEKKAKDPRNYGSKVETPVHRVDVAIPGHYLARQPEEVLTTNQVAYNKMKELERQYFGAEIDDIDTKKMLQRAGKLQE